MNPVCFHCGIGLHGRCTGMVRPVSLPAEPCRCIYPIGHPQSAAVAAPASPRQWDEPAAAVLKL